MMLFVSVLQLIKNSATIFSACYNMLTCCHMVYVLFGKSLGAEFAFWFLFFLFSVYHRCSIVYTFHHLAALSKQLHLQDILKYPTCSHFKFHLYCLHMLP